MTIKQSISFGIAFIGDGTSKSITITVATAPLTLQYPLVESSGAASTKFDVTTLTVTGIINLSSDDGQAVTATVGLLGATITFTWPNAPTSGARVLVSGYLAF